MTPATGKAILISAFFATIAMITWQDYKTEKELGPRPKRYVSACVAFGLLGLFEPVISPELASVIGAGLALGLAYKNAPKDEVTTERGGGGTSQQQTRPGYRSSTSLGSLGAITTRAV